MPSPTIDATIQQIEQTKGVIQSAIVFISGVAQRIQDAIAAALANGATAAELAPVQNEVDTLKSKTDELAAAIAANP